MPREYPDQHPNYPNRDHFESTLSRLGYEDVPRCRAWKTDHSEQCGNPAMKGLPVCVDHGGAGVRNNKRINDRKEFQEALAEYDDGSDIHINPQLIAQLAGLCKKGNLDAIKYWFDQQFGAPRSTVVYEITNEGMYRAFLAVAAEFIGPDKWELFQSKLQSALPQNHSDSTEQEMSDGK